MDKQGQDFLWPVVVKVQVPADGRGETGDMRKSDTLVETTREAGTTTGDILALIE